jgi:hypothetical protein
MRTGAERTGTVAGIRIGRAGRWAWACAVTVAAFAWAGDVPRAATKPSARASSRQAVPAALTEAVAKLTAEAEAFAKDPAAAPMRDRCDYFPEPPADVSVDAVLDHLNAPIHRNPLVAGYVKWQLLSALPLRVPDENVRDAVAAYRKSPPVAPRPGSTMREQSAMKQWIAGLKDPGQIDSYNQQWQEKTAVPRKQNDVVMAFRDGLYQRLPKNDETIRLYLQDLYERVQQGYEVHNRAEAATADIRTWALTADKPAELLAMADLLTKLRWFKGPVVFLFVKVDGDQIVWKPKDFFLNPQRNDDPKQDAFMLLAGELRTAAANAKATGGGGLRLKDEKRDDKKDRK